MENNESSESSSHEEQSEYSDIDSERPNLLQINKKIEKMKRQKDLELLDKKTKRSRNNTDIIYDSNKKTIEDSFVPNLEELNNFLQNCKIEEIKFEEIEKIPKDKIFDPDLFIEENYRNKGAKIDEMKNSFSLEDLGFFLDNNEKKIEEPKENPVKENKIEEDKNINKILQEKDLKKQKKEIHDLIEKIKKMSLEEVKKSLEGKANTKLNIVFDLDNTCIFAIAQNQKEILSFPEKYPKKDFKIINFEHKGNNMIAVFTIRKGLKEFFDFTQSFCNFYVSTLGFEAYGSNIKEILQNKFDIIFLGFKGRKNLNEKNKYLYDLNLDKKNTVIFDDKPAVWKHDKENVIISKLFTDKEINYEILKRKYLQHNIDHFLRDYGPFFYYKSSPENWQKQYLNEKPLCPFFDFEGRNCFSGEYLNSSKYQFIFMKETIKIIYYLVYNSNIGVPDALKLIRYNVFFNSCFDLDFYNSDRVETLKDIIINCGGVIYNKKEKNNFKDMKFFFVCSSDEYNSKKDKIKKEKNFVNENAKVINDKYIINCFYFMSNLENDLSNPNYCLDLNEEDNFDDY